MTERLALCAVDSVPLGKGCESHCLNLWRAAAIHVDNSKLSGPGVWFSIRQFKSMHTLHCSVLLERIKWIHRVSFYSWICPLKQMQSLTHSLTHRSLVLFGPSVSELLKYRGRPMLLCIALIESGFHRWWKFVLFILACFFCNTSVSLFPYSRACVSTFNLQKKTFSLLMHFSKAQKASLTDCFPRILYQAQMSCLLFGDLSWKVV